MFLLNKLRNFINSYPFIRRLFVSLVSIFVIPLLNLQSYLSINGYRRRRKISLLRKITILLDKLELKKIIIDKRSSFFFIKMEQPLILQKIDSQQVMRLFFNETTKLMKQS